MSKQDYQFTTRDKSLISAAVLLLRKMAVAPITKPGQLKTVTKVLNALVRLPELLEQMDVSICVCGPELSFGVVRTHEFWDIRVTGSYIWIESSGSYARTDEPIHDSFTTMTWSASPGRESEFHDYRDSLRIVPNIQSFQESVAGIDFEKRRYSFEIYDYGNPSLEQDEEA